MLGLKPTSRLSAAGTRPEPAVSVPSANAACPRATATAEPELEPPLISSSRSALRVAPYGLRVPTSPVANWSRFALPTGIAPASISRRTTSACASGTYAYAGHPAVVGQPATSMLSFTANGTPHSGLRSGSNFPSSRRNGFTASRDGGVIQMLNRASRSARFTIPRTTSSGVAAPEAYSALSPPIVSFSGSRASVRPASCCRSSVRPANLLTPPRPSRAARR